MNFELPKEITEIRAAVRALCETFPPQYWRALEPDHYPEEFVRTLTEKGWLAALIPEEYGGGGLGLSAASVILEQINDRWVGRPLRCSVTRMQSSRLLVRLTASS